MFKNKRSTFSQYNSNSNSNSNTYQKYYEKRNTNFNDTYNNANKHLSNNANNKYIKKEITYSNNIKTELIDFIYSKLDINKYKYTIIENEEQINKLFDKKYNISFNYSGVNGFLVFIKLNGSFYSFVVDRKTL